MQDPKYRFAAAMGGDDGVVVNRHTGETIPADEPVMVFRARDVRALPMIEYYRSLCQDAEHQAAVDQRIAEFEEFKARFPWRMKEPDTPR